MAKIIELDVPEFDKLTEELYLKIIDDFGNYKVDTIQKLEYKDAYIEDLKQRIKKLEDKINCLKLITNDIVGRI